MSRLLAGLASIGTLLCAAACYRRPEGEQCAEEDRECLNDQYYDNCEEIQRRLDAQYGFEPPPAWDDQVAEDPPSDLEALRKIVENRQCTITTYWTSAVDQKQSCEATVTFQLTTTRPPVEDDITPLDNGLRILHFTRTEDESCYYVPQY